MEANLRCGKKSVRNVELCMFLLFVLLVPLSCETTMSTTNADNGKSVQKLEVEKHLKSLNKPPVKSIESVDGDIIDCVNILHQPAFDHPDLKNHKIQMTPNSHPEGSTSDSNKPLMRQLWHKNGRCPKGTIPIRRTKMDELLRAGTIQKFGKKEQGSFPHLKSAQPQPNNSSLSTSHKHAVVSVDGDIYHGGSATINVWNPKVQQPNEFSLSQIWVLAGSFDSKDLNTIEAGLMVNPNLFGDNQTRLFTYWTMDTYISTGCYNIRCPGFIQISNHIALGATIHPYSKYGSTQYHIDILIWKDPVSGDWWLRCGKYNLGYWPATLFSSLRNKASMIEWGGEVVNTEFGGQYTSTQMGSGHFPYEGYRKASYFNKIKIVDGDNKLRDPSDLSTFTENENCYSIKTGRSSDWGNYFYYGGPGRNPNCP